MEKLYQLKILQCVEQDIDIVTYCSKLYQTPAICKVKCAQDELPLIAANIDRRRHDSADEMIGDVYDDEEFIKLFHEGDEDVVEIANQVQHWLLRTSEHDPNVGAGLVLDSYSFMWVIEGYEVVRLD